MKDLLRKTNSSGYVEIGINDKIIQINPSNFKVISPAGNTLKWSVSNGYEVCKVGLRIGSNKHTYHILKHRLMVYLYGDKYGNTIDQLAAVGCKANVVDHIDSNRLNNSIENLQVVSKRYNSSREKSLKSGLPTGVVWHKRDKKYMSYIKINGKTTFIGYFKTIEEASAAYQNKVKELK